MKIFNINKNPNKIVFPYGPVMEIKDKQLEIWLGLNNYKIDLSKIETVLYESRGLRFYLKIVGGGTTLAEIKTINAEKARDWIIDRIKAHGFDKDEKKSN